MPQNVIPIGVSESSNSHPIGSFGDFLTKIGGYVSNYDFVAGLFPELLPVLPFLDVAFKGLGSYINAIEDHKFDKFLPLIPGFGDRPDPSPVGGSIPSLLRRATVRNAPRTPGGFVQVSADVPRGFVQLARQ